MDKTKLISTLWSKGLEALWILALVGLPLTSLPLLVDLTGAIVTPFSALPILALIIIWLAPRLLRGASLPKENGLFAIFLVIVIISAANAHFLDIPSFKGKTVIGQEARALLTLAIGVSFYFMFSSWNENTGRLDKSLKWITVGGIFSLCYTCLQVVFVFQNDSVYPDWYFHLQDILAVKSPSFAVRGDRISGLTYEPSWFAHQMNMLYFPLWMAATFERRSSFKLRLMGLTIENILLFLGFIEFFLSSPRIGMVAFFLMLVVLFFKINTAIRNKILKMLTERRPFSQPSRLRQTAISLALSSILLTIYAGITVGVFSIAVRLDQRVELLISRSLESTELHDALMLKERAIIMVAHRYAFFERVLYWTMGWHVFEKFPWLGVGPGNTGFFFLAEAPDLAWASYEMREVVYRLTSLPNVKSFWVRLLSETGWLGFSTFVIWLYILWSSSKVTAQSRDGTLRTIALAGQLALAAFIAEGFSIDSYAMPYLWIWLGFSSAAGLIFRSTSFRSGMFLPPEHIGEQRNS